MELKLTWIIQLLVAFHAYPALGFQHELPRSINQKPTRIIGNVTVIDTPLVRAAQAYARQVSENFLFNHIMRTWLFGVLVINHNTTLQQTVDLEVHAIGSILHDLGLVLNGSWISSDRRFEVDSAFAATGFVEGQIANDDADSAWDANRLQLLWDTVVLSSEYRISLYKQATVATVMKGVLIDLTGQAYGLTTPEYDNVIAAFPKLNFLPGVNQTLVQLCKTKANTTYDSWQQAFGDAFVPHYSAVGYRIFDIITGI
ncbi:hypothetical protein NA56DRAFT_586999 [Hyaloscypha hepaticicola]|uniref:HD domain-containing protein n=1 Tax=Hyaloscypha hepaticicola TaxID=2082293 RepID=A0A2J6PER9_9HELO|nr:hypothetical protein NA56DRAFT_586999 [Hyaloscypha hepaticicola]